MVFELNPDLQLRFSAAKVMSRAELGSLTPSIAATVTTQNATVNNPFLEPIRATTADLGLEWYFRPGSLLSVAYFYKDIETYIQRITSDEPWSSLGLPDSLLAGSPSNPSSIFHVTRWENTDGGPLNGFEFNAQVQFDWLEGWASGFGVLANYTHVESEIEYILTSVAGVPTVTTTNDLVDLSPNSASGTLFYDNGTFSIRTTASYRDNYIRAIPASAGSDVRANKANTFVDARRLERERQPVAHLRSPEPDGRAQHAVHRQRAPGHAVPDGDRSHLHVSERPTSSDRNSLRVLTGRPLRGGLFLLLFSSNSVPLPNAARSVSLFTFRNRLHGKDGGSFGGRS